MRTVWTLAAAAIVGGALLGIGGSPAQAFISNPGTACDVPDNLVSNCSFEGSSGQGSFEDWTQGGNTTFQGITSTTGQVHSGNYAYFEGPVDTPGTLSQILATDPDTLYQISVWYQWSGTSPSDFQIQWAQGNLNDPSNPGAGFTIGTPEVLFETCTAGITPAAGACSPEVAGYQQEVVTAMSGDAGADELQFSFLNNPSFDQFDDVCVVPVGDSQPCVVPTVPEPASMTLLGSALLGFGLYRRRRKTS